MYYFKLNSTLSIYLIYREMGLEPSVETYKVLMCGFAEKGDIKSMLEIFEKAKKEEASLKGIHLLSVVTDLVLAGHKDKLPEVIRYD